MARRHPALRVALLALAGCAAPPPRPSPEPIRAEDLAALPAPITRENAADVVRKCLQRHAAEATTSQRRVGYRFHAEGIERIVFETFSDGRRDRWTSRRAAWAELKPLGTETRIDPTRLRRVTDVSAGAWTWSFDDPGTALALARALGLLQTRE